MQQILSYIQSPLWWGSAIVAGVLASLVSARVRDKIGRRQIPATSLTESHYARGASDDQVLFTVGALGYQLRAVSRIFAGLLVFVLGLMLPDLVSPSAVVPGRTVAFLGAAVLIIAGYLDDVLGSRFRRRLYQSFQKDIQ